MTNPKQTSGQSSTDARSITEQDINEEWKDIEGYGGRYKISNHGDVYSSKLGRCLKQQTSHNGYYQVLLCRNGKHVLNRVSRLVALAFVDNPENHPVVNHIDKDRKNNHYSNLEWCTTQQNVEHSLAKEYVFSNPKGEKVVVFNLSKFCRENGYNQGTMAGVHNGVFPAYKGWTKW